MKIFTNKLTIVIIFSLIANCAIAQSGTVFRDYNANGTKDTNEPLVSGILVKAYNASGALCASATSAGATAPNYTLPTTCTGQVRVEFEIPTTGNCVNSGIDFSSASGTAYGSSIQFVTAAATNVNFAVHNPSDYNTGTTGVNVFIPCYISGDPLVAGDAANGDWFVGYPYTNSGPVGTGTGAGTAPSQKVNGAIIGPTWGVAYSKQAKKVFTSALLKRHSGLGKMGSGGIYMLTPTATSFTVTEFYDMDANGHRTRADASAPAYGEGTSYSIASNSIITYLGSNDPLTGKPSGLGVIGTNTQRGLTSDPTDPSYDPAMFDQVGKVGIGDIDISDDGKFLFVMNLYSRKVFRLELNDAYNPTAVLSVTSYDVPATTCTAGEYRPWGLKFFRNKLYVGVVCSAENAGTNANLTASVYELNNPTAAATFNSTAVITLPLDYTKPDDYNPWTKNSADVDAGADRYATPILSDIEFTDNGDMMLGIMDRSGHQWGEQNYRSLKTTTETSTISTSGDILAAGFNCGTGAFTLENNGTFTSATGSVLTGSSTLANEGPGGKEFFYDNSAAGDPHKESATGALAVLKGQGEVMSTAFAMNKNSGDAGTMALSTTNGSFNDYYQLYYRNNPAGIFAKANGLGDIELSGIEAPIEIGNRIWDDTDKDGIQDADELGISGITVTLCDATGTPIAGATATTDANGNYYLSSAAGTSTPSAIYGLNLSVNTNYILKFPLTSGTKSLTTKDLGGNDLIDSDAGTDGKITFTTGIAGQNNHTFDVGYSVAVACTPPTAVTAGSNSPVNEGSAINLTSTSTGGTSYSWAGPNGFTSTTQNPSIASATAAMAGTYTVTVLSSGTCTATATTAVVVTPTTVACTPPTAVTAGSNSPVNEGSAINLTSTSTGGTSYSWAGPNGFTSTTQNPSIASATAAMAGTYTVTVLSSGTCTATATTAVVVNTNTACPATTYPICAGESYTITAQSGITDIQWYKISGVDTTAISGAVNSTLIVTEAGKYIWKGKDATSCNSVLCCPMEIVTGTNCVVPCTPPTAVTAGSNSPVNEGSAINLTSTSTGGTSYSWAGPNGFTSTSQNPSIASATTAMAGTYTVTVLSSGTCTATATVAVIITPAPCPVTDYKLCAGESYTLTAQAGLTGYQWFTIVGTDTTAIGGATNDTYNATAIGKYIWKAKDATGCDIKLCCPVEIIPGICYGSIGDYVWTDTNNDGQQGTTEAPIAGVKVYLLDGTTGAKLDSTLTDATGKYLFDSLLTGSYQVQFVAPAGTIAAKQNTGADVTDSDANKAGLSQLINIDTTKLPTDTLRNNPQIDAGFVPVGSIGDYVFEDLDKSNTQTAGDTPLAGVKVYLLDATTGAKLDSTTTDAAGLYLFDSLVAGNYKVQFVAPSGTLLVSKTSGTDVTKDSNPDPTTGITDAVTIDTTKPIGDPARDNRDVDAGIQLVPAFGSIGDYVWSDVNDNGQQDGTETPIAGVKVYLYDATGTSILDSTLTDASGKYLFDSLLTGAYKVKFVAPAGTFPSNQNTGADVTDSDANDLGWSQVVNIDATKAETDTLRNNPQIDAGFVPFGSIGDYVFNDKDNSNTQTAGDLPVEGVKVYLLDATTGAKLDSTLTDAAGLYKFDSLIAGNYKVQVVPPTGMLVVTKDSGTDDTKDSDIDATGTTGSYTVDVTKPIGDPLRDITSVDAGIKGNPQYGSIGDYVWFDNNNNGQQDGTELPIKNIKVYLYDATGTTKLDSTLTDASGKYLFDSLTTGGYKVKFVAPGGTFPAKQNTGADVTDSDANALGWSQVVNIDVTKLATDTLRNNPQIDAGFVPFGSIGDYVFDDKDNSNTQTAGDLPISGVKVYLLDATTGAKLDSTLTDGAGKYLFDSLVAGNYKVQFVAPSGTLIVTKTSGTDVTKDSNPDPTTGITDAVTIDTTQPVGDPARDNRDVDAGIKSAPQFGSIGDYVWTDTNNNGQQDAAESPIAGVKVYLYDATGTTKLDSTLTDASGKYLFDSLITAGYKVQFVAPAGTIAAKQNTGADVSDSDANKLGWSQVINIDASLADTDTLRNNPQIDAGFVPVGSIGDYVFIDKDNSNTQTAGDLPMEGVKVYLLDATTGAKLDSTLTDASGLYKFDSLVAGNYKVQFVVPTGMTAVTKDSGTDDTKDSDIDPTGTTGTVTVDTTKPIGDPLRDITSVDAGLKGIPQYGSIGDYVWFDNNNNGQQDGTESPIQGVKVYLYDAAGTTILDSALTDATGKYLFDSLLTGGYKVKFVAPTGTIPAKQNTGADVTDSDANKLGWSQVVNIDVTKLVTDTLRNNPQIDAGFVPFGSIGDYVFQDKDNSNTQTAGDTPIPCIVVYLLDATTGAKLDSTMTDISGKYQFDSLLAGNYKVQFVAPIGGTFVTPISGTDVTKDSNPDATGLTATVTIDPTQPIGSPGRDNRDVDAGLKIVGPFGSIGDYVWSDVNNNGQQDGTEAPIAGVKVYLYDGTGTMIMDSTVTDAAGKYLFDSLFTADYRVKFVAPAGTIASKQNTGADVTDSDANKAGWSQIISIDVTKLATDTLRNNPQIDAGFVPVGSIGDYVFEDKDNSNTQTAGDAPIQGVKVYLLDATTGAKLDSTITDGAGKYQFDSLIAGIYKVQFVAPSGTDLVTKTSGTDVTKDSNPDPTTGITDAVTIDTTQPIGSPARDNRDVDAGIKASLAYGSLGDYVWMDTDNDGQQDASEAPIAGVKVYLYDASGTTKLDSTLTDGSGKYLFDSLLTGSYKVKFVAPAGTISAKQNTGADVTDSDANKLGWSQVVNINVALSETDTLRNNPQIDAGFIPVGSIGDYVFNDKDNSNTQTAGDLPIAGVKVYLLDATTGAKLDSTITDSNGLYKFDSLLAGNYKVQVVAPTGMTVVTKDSGTDDTKDSDIDPTGTTGIVTVNTNAPIGDPLRDITNVDAGLKGNPAYGSIGNFVWTDQNNNGQQDGTETPIEGVKVYLYDGTGTVLLDSTLTNAAGNYLFDSLLTGSYKVKFVAPVGTIPAKQNTGADVSDSDANKLGWSQVVNIDVTKLATDTLRNNPQIDAGFVPVGSIGDYVFNDKDESNTQTAGDLPIGGVKVYLLDATTGAKLDSTITDGAGKYLFDSLVAGNYKVQFVAPVGTNLVTKTVGTDITKDSNPNPATGITDAVTIDTTQPIGSPARDNRDVDAGIKGQPQYGSLGDYVWMDTDNDGQQDATEAPIAGVKVYLYDAAGLVKIDSALTDATGKYSFDSLLTGGYKVKFVAPAGTIAAKQNTGADVTDSDANKAGWSQVVNIDVTLSSTDTLRNNPQIDAGFVPVGSIGDYVFEDKDNSNTQTAGDLPVAGVKVYLLDAVTGAKLDSTVTNISGLYKFDSLLAGNYKVQFVAPVGTNLVTKTVGTDITKDSNPNPATGITDAVTIDTTQPIGSPARDNRDVDAGIKGQPQYGSLGDYVWMDTDNDGQQDATEAPIAGVKVYLYDAAGLVKIDSALTDATGKYLFDSLLTGGYKVKFVAPAGTIAAKQNTGADVTDSDANKAGWSQVVNIDVTLSSTDTLRNNPQIDAGFVPVGSIGDYVYSDKDNSNTQTAGDTPVSGVKVYLLNATTGAKLDSTVTNINGLYKFDSLIAGNYKVQFVAPVGTTLVTKDSGTDDTKDSDPNAGTGITDVVAVDTTKPLGDPARDVTSVDAGLKLSKADISLKKTAVGNCKRNVGDTVTFQILVKREDLLATSVNLVVKDSLSANFEFVSAAANNGTYNNTTGLWSISNLMQGDSAFLTVVAKIKVGTLGLVCNDAWVYSMDKDDFDSIAGNKIETEDDFARACVSVAIPLCSARGEKVEITAPTGYASYQWYKNGQAITGANSSTYLVTSFGDYSVTVNSGTCPGNACCPIYVEDVCDCPPTICVPFVIQKTKSKK